MCAWLAERSAQSKQLTSMHHYWNVLLHRCFQCVLEEAGRWGDGPLHVAAGMGLTDGAYHFCAKKRLGYHVDVHPLEFTRHLDQNMARTSDVCVRRPLLAPFTSSLVCQCSKGRVEDYADLGETSNKCRLSLSAPFSGARRHRWLPFVKDTPTLAAAASTLSQ